MQDCEVEKINHDLKVAISNLEKLKKLYKSDFSKDVIEQEHLEKSLYDTQSDCPKYAKKIDEKYKKLNITSMNIFIYRL